MRKVTWPTREQMIAFTTVTVVTCVLLTGVIFAIDIAMKEFVFWLGVVTMTGRPSKQSRSSRTTVGRSESSPRS